MIHPTPDQLASMTAHASDDRRPWFVGVNTACLVLAYFAVGLRLISRLKIGTHIGLDDHLILASTLILTGHVACLLVAVRLGMGRHAIFITDAKEFAVTNIVAQTFYGIMIATIKLSILSLYARIFQRTVGWFKPTLWGTSLLVVLIMIPQCFTYVFRCVPVDSLWNEYAGPQYRIVCINFQAALVAFGVLNIVTDWFILLLPIPVVWRLSLETRAKWSICSLFAVGAFTCVVSIVRLFYTRRVDDTTDPSWDYVHLNLISTIECAAGILAACMPTWRPLFKFLRSGIGGYFSDKAKSTENLALGFGNTTRIGRGGWADRVRARSKSRSRSRSAARGDRRRAGADAGVPGVPGLKAVMGKRSESSMSGESVEKMLKSTDMDVEAGMGIEMTPQSSPPTSLTSPLSAALASPMPAATLPASPPKHPLKQKEKHKSKHKKRFSLSRPRSDDLSPDTAAPAHKSTYKAKAGADRWESIQKRQLLKRPSSPSAAQTPSDGAAWTGGGMIYGGGISRPAHERRLDGERRGRGRGSEDGGDGGAGAGAAGGSGSGLGIVVTKTVVTG